MCGILGAFAPQSSKNAFDSKFPETFREALDLVKHRGPDGSGFWMNGADPLIFVGLTDPAQIAQKFKAYFDTSREKSCVAFGHRRLSIIDLSDEAYQPMGVASKGATRSDLWTIFNGEVYNYLEIRQELSRLGYTFQTKSDTEVLLRAYEEWGTDCFKKFNGMWGMAIWDERKRELVLSRDRMGVKPLYYTVVLGRLFFGSEIKELLEIQRRYGMSVEWNPYRVYEFLAHSRQHHAEETFYRGIYQLRPARWAKLSADAAVSPEAIRAASQAYWDFPAEERAISFKDAARELRETLEAAVILRLRSDVPVGSALSGGLDSSAIVSLISRLNPKRQKTISATFKGAAIDERKYAEMVVQGKNIDSIFVSPSPDELLGVLDRLIQHQDGPFLTTSIFAQWEVFKGARKNGLTVMLDGQGADELFAGYEGFLKAHLRSTQQRSGSLSAVIEGVRFVKNHPASYPLSKFTKKLKKKQSPLRLFSESARQEIEERAQLSDPYLLGDAEPKYADPLKQALYLAAVRTSLPALLTYEDRNSMAFSIESRTPFLDYRLVELAFRCPASFHMRGGMRKALLREALKGVVPEAIRTRKDKIGFATPEDQWAKTHFKALKEPALRALSAAVFDQNEVRSELEGSRNWRMLCALLSEAQRATS